MKLPHILRRSLIIFSLMLALGMARGQYIPNGTQITNTASIYFDLNPAVVTNTVTNTVRSCAPTYVNQYDTICNGSSYIFFGAPLTTAGTYTDTIINGSGCDSITTLYLAVRPTYSAALYDTICGGTSFIFGGDTLMQSGIYTDTLHTVGGCDSITTLYLTVRPAQSSAQYDTICAGSYYTFMGDSLTQSGIYADTMAGSGGCDSLHILYLHVDTANTPVIAAAGNLMSGGAIGAVSYQWFRDGQAIPGADSYYYTATEAGSYTLQGTDSFGCAASSFPTILSDGINEVTTAGQAISLHPNPNSGSFTLETTGATGAEYTITDMIGRQITSATISADSQPIEVPLAPGVYQITVRFISGAMGTLRYEVVR